ncbi:hypothetical protein C6P61_09615 [Malikia spinosa]|uniref:Uncharacterized protein n=1 Tax=Malikia spinosa TaxID=86180 RepID=A0A2S9KE72_9BURK|nr:hypothetical protein [Malikia spinosa]PRD68749.1 hypothetical protein C6P61_09615 [Malikia spinosa]
MNSQPVPPATLRALAALALLLGLACAVVNGWFFALGLEQLEPDSTARAPLLLAGWLMVTSEHVAVGLAALLPAAFAGLRRRLLWLGLALLAFEVLSMFAAQRALEHVNVTATTAQATQAAGLRAAIDSQRTTLEQLRSNGARQSESANAWRQHLGAAALRDSLAGQQRLQALEAELATLQGGIRPTLTGVLGASGATALAAARALLIGVMGLVLMSAAGQLWAAGRTGPTPAEAISQHPGSSPSTPTPQTAERPAKRPGVDQASSQIPPKRPPALRAKARDRPEHETP